MPSRVTPPVREALERHQVWGYLAAILAGLGLGMTRPEAAEALEGALWPLLGLLLYATFTQVPLGRLDLAARDWRFGAALLAGNFLILPLAMGAMVLLLPLAPAVQVGVLLVLLVLCTDWFISFTHLGKGDAGRAIAAARSEEHTSELQSRPHLVCRLLLEKKNDLLKHD